MTESENLTHEQREPLTLCRRCGVRPGTVRYYVPNALGASLAGQQVKFSTKQTVGCDECWAEFSAALSGLDQSSNAFVIAGWTVADEGIVDGVQYVTILDDGLNPIEYNVTAEWARQEYGLTLDQNPMEAS